MARSIIMNRHAANGGIQPNIVNAIQGLELCLDAGHGGLIPALRVKLKANASRDMTGDLRTLTHIDAQRSPDNGPATITHAISQDTAMQPIKIWRKKAGLFKPLRPERRLARVVTRATQLLMAEYSGGHWRKSVGSVLNAIAPATITLKALSFKLRSARRFWGSSTSIDIRLKW